MGNVQRQALAEIWNDAISELPRRRRKLVSAMCLRIRYQQAL